VSRDGLTVAPAVLNFDLWVMVAVAAASLPVFLAGREIGRGKGVMFLAYYAAYVAYLILGAREHDALDEYSAIMATFVLPITFVTLVAMVFGAQSHRRKDDRPGRS
jgi:cation:H+ antiporter